MSLETWKKAFYPIPATATTIAEAVYHSLRKWKGIRRKNLEKHGMRVGYRCIKEDTPVNAQMLIIDNTSCALCVHHLYGNTLYTTIRCHRCPLSLYRRGVSCDHPLRNEVQAPYATFLRSGDPEPMIALLNAVWKREKKESTQPILRRKRGRPRKETR